MPCARATNSSLPQCTAQASTEKTARTPNGMPEDDLCSPTEEVPSPSPPPNSEPTTQLPRSQKARKGSVQSAARVIAEPRPASRSRSRSSQCARSASSRCRAAACSRARASVSTTASGAASVTASSRSGSSPAPSASQVNHGTGSVVAARARAAPSAISRWVSAGRAARASSVSRTAGGSSAPASGSRRERPGGMPSWPRSQRARSFQAATWARHWSSIRPRSSPVSNPARTCSRCCSQSARPMRHAVRWSAWRWSSARTARPGRSPDASRRPRKCGGSAGSSQRTRCSSFTSGGSAVVR